MKKVSSLDRSLIKSAIVRLADRMRDVEQATNTRALREAICDLRIATNEIDKLAWEVEVRTNQREQQYHILEGV